MVGWDEMQYHVRALGVVRLWCFFICQLCQIGDLYCGARWATVIVYMVIYVVVTTKSTKLHSETTSQSFRMLTITLIS
jgi:hypothetical protein